MSSARPIPALGRAPAAGSPAATGPLGGIPAEGLFIGGALAQYVGASLAVLLFAVVPASGVAWLRVLAAAGALAIWRRPWQARWSARTLGLAAVFGLALAGMNLTFYLAIDRLPLGTAVAIEFAGPIAVATLGSRTRRDFGALALAIGGVVLLADLHFSGAPLGVGLALAAGGLWALYIVLGHRLAMETQLRPRDGLAAGMGIGALAFAPFLVSSAAPAFAAPWRLGACLLVGLLSSVVPYAIDQLAMTRLPRARFALLLSILPATAAIIGAVVLGQLPGVVEVLGIGLVVTASAMRSHAASV
ncbi:MAG TPA: EamA family transporter [Solirubrobacteraceae bacterium]|nr:EamA family transporter [Solirubrobacteraceae bacterium]